MKVRMKCNTAYKGPVYAGQEIDVPNDFARRWSKNGIAEIIEKAEAPIQDEALTPRQLYNLCISKGLEAEPKKDAEYYTKLLEEAGV